MLTAVLTLSLFAGCKKNDIPDATKENIVTAADFVLADNTVGFPRLAATDGVNIYLLSAFSETNTDILPKMADGNVDYANIPPDLVYSRQIIYLIKADLSGNVVAKTELSNVTNLSMGYTDYSRLFTGKDGKIYAIRQNQFQETDADGNTVYNMKTELVSFDDALTPSTVCDIGEAVADAVENSRYIYVDRCILDKDGIFYFYYNNIVLGVDTKTAKMVYKSEELGENTYVQDIIVMPDGKTGLSTYHYEMTDGNSNFEMKIAPIDPVTGTLGEASDLPTDVSIIGSDPERGYIGYTNSSIDYMGADGVKTTLINMLASGISVLNITAFSKTDDGRYIVISDDYTMNQPSIKILTPVDPETIANRKLIKVAALYQDTYLTEYIAAFNRTNAEYQAELVTYYNSDSSNLSDSMTAMNTAILAGQIPDVLNIETGMPYDSYVKKGMFTDLYPLIEADETLSADDMVSSVLKALEVNGKLYSLSPSFTVMTLIGRKDVFGDRQGLTFDELQAIADERGAELFPFDMGRDGFVSQYINSTLHNYVNKETGECSFDSPEFISLLNMAKTMPDSAALDLIYASSDINWMEEQGKLRSGDVLLNMNYMNEFRRLPRLEKGDFGAEISFIGVPNAAGNSGIAANLTFENAIMEKAANKDGAWVFLRGLLDYDSTLYGGSMENEGGSFGGYPILKTKLAAFADRALTDRMQRNYESGEYEPSPEMYYGSGMDGMIEIPNNTPEDNARVYALIDGVVNINRGDTNLQDIIEDDLKTFFDGSKSAEETAAIIQNRATTYLAESA
jgi:ABC-type glycerol-3-phosphate transport system substrate-binding protein